MFVLLIASFNGSTALAITCNMTQNLNMFYSFRTWLSLGFHYISWYRTSSVHNVFFKTKQNQINCRQKYFHIKFILLFKTIILKTGLRWRNRRMWSSPPATSTSKYIYTRENSQKISATFVSCSFDITQDNGSFLLVHIQYHVWENELLMYHQHCWETISGSAECLEHIKLEIYWSHFPPALLDNEKSVGPLPSFSRLAALSI